MALGTRQQVKMWKLDNCPTVQSLYSWNIAECHVKPQPTNWPIEAFAQGVRQWDLSVPVYSMHKMELSDKHDTYSGLGNSPSPRLARMNLAAFPSGNCLNNSSSSSLIPICIPNLNPRKPRTVESRKLIQVFTPHPPHIIKIGLTYDLLTWLKGQSNYQSLYLPIKFEAS